MGFVISLCLLGFGVVVATFGFVRDRLGLKSHGEDELLLQPDVQDKASSST